MLIKFLPNTAGNPPGKLAEVELHFTQGLLTDLKLIGFSVWERRGGNGRNVTFPARQYAVNGERRSFALLRPATTNPQAQQPIRDLILGAFECYEATPDHNGIVTVDEVTGAIMTTPDARWQSYRVTFRQENGREQAWTRFAPNDTHARTGALTDLAREYPDGAELIDVVPCPDPRLTRA